jgi:hypothetical protein|nr:MAG TPA: hypothetical protein [Caudoviricetes sp.]
MDNKNEPKIEFSSELLMQINGDRKAFNEGVFDYKLPQILDDVAYPLGFSEAVEVKKKFNVTNLGLSDSMDEFIAYVLQKRGIDDKQILGVSYADLLMFGYRVYLGTFDAQSIAAKK